ncbi:MAG: Na(+)/H(+) antiporter subunit D, partial [Parvularculaceae bacterium]
MTSASSLLSAIMINPAVIMTVGAVLCILTPAAIRRVFMLVFIAASAFELYRLGLGRYGELTLFGEAVTMIRIDPLSRIFAIVFHIAAALNVLYAWHDKDRATAFATLAYPAAALGGVLAGDLLTLFVWWEIAAATSVLLVFAPGTRAGYVAGLRYLAIQVLSGVLLLAGVVLVFYETGALAFEAIGLRDPSGAIKASGLLMLFAFGIKAAFPLLHTWVQDAYPKSTISGTIVLSIFTTKLAVYALARSFPGTPELIWIGTIMTLFPIFFALIENDLRKVLCYSINNQVGFMVVGIGVGTAAALNGAVGYAFSNIIFESLLFMAVGAAMYRTGTSKATELGGLYKTMPLTMIFCLIGALSISAFPFFAGFVTKGLIIDGVAEEHLFVIWLALLFASAGVLEHAGIKIPYFTFFAHDSGKRPKEAPWHMLLAMTIAAVMCVGIGVYPEPLYALLPHQEAIAGYEPYALAHIAEYAQLLLWAVLAFAILIITKWYPPETPATNIDTDWFWRVPGRAILNWTAAAATSLWGLIWGVLIGRGRALAARIYAVHGPEGSLARSWPIGSMA